MKYVHPLIERATKYARPVLNLEPAGCFYDEVVGAWRFFETRKLWVETSGRVGPMTKKADIETGEDQKGE